jgi:hypothetical protein
MQTGEATEVVIDDAEQQSSTPRPQAEPVEAPKIIPPARNTRTDENNQTEPTDNSDSAVQDLRELPREVRDKAKDAIKKQSEELRRRVEEENRKRAEKDQPPIPLPPRVQHENQRR